MTGSSEKLDPSMVDAAAKGLYDHIFGRIPPDKKVLWEDQAEDVKQGFREEARIVIEIIFPWFMKH
jgi:hypothetical protein